MLAEVRLVLRTRAQNEDLLPRALGADDFLDDRDGGGVDALGAAEVELIRISARGFITPAASSSPSEVMLKRPPRLCDRRRLKSSMMSPRITRAA